MLKRILLVSLAFCILGPVIHTQQIEVAKAPLPVFVRPDIVVENIKVSSQPWDEPGKIMVRIDYTLFNDSSKNTSCCPTAAGKQGWQEHPAANLLFNIRVESRSYPDGRFKKLANGGTVGTLLKPYERADFHASEVISKGKTKQYRVIADYGNWINEKNEDNNFKTIIWPLRTKVLKGK